MGHIVIAGPGRAGTTLLVLLLQRLGFDATPNQRTYFEESKAGLESDLLATDAPHVVKNPDLTWQLPELLRSGRVDARSVEWLVVPLRDLDQAAASRVSVTSRTRDLHAPGGLVRTMHPSRQRSELAETTYELFHAAAEFDLPLVVLEYPRFALDIDYARRRLSPVIGERGTGFAEAWTEAVDPSLVREAPIQVPRMAGLKLGLLRIRRAVKARLVS